MNNDNSAGRLYNVLQALTNLSVGGRSDERLIVFFELAPSPEHVKGHKIFPLIPQLIHRLTAILTLTDEAEQDLKAIDDLTRDLYLTPFTHIRNTISGLLTNLHSEWSNYLAEFKKIDFRGLQFCSDVLSKVSIEQAIDATTLKDLLTDVDAFYQEVIDSDIHWETKHFILDRLDDIRTAIREYRIRGAEGLRECLGKTIGLMYVNPHLVLRFPDQTSHKEKFFNIVGRLSSIVDLGTKVLALGHKAKPAVAAILKGYLESGNPPPS